MESTTYDFPVYMHTIQAHSQDLQNGGLHGVFGVYVYIYSHASVARSGGMLPQEIFRNEIL